MTGINQQGEVCGQCVRLRRPCGRCRGQRRPAAAAVVTHDAVSLPVSPADATAGLFDLPGVADVTERFTAAGEQCVLVGGCVRDALLGRVPKDVDVAVSTPPERTRQLVAGIGPVLDVGAEFGTVAVMVDGADEPLELTTFRAETYEWGSRKPGVEWSTDLVDDLARRDFTINAVAVTRDGVFDPFDGQSDLAAGVVRAVGDPVERFTDDPLRIVRAARFAARYRFDIDPATRAGMTETDPLIAHVATERVRAEAARFSRVGDLRRFATELDGCDATLGRVFGGFDPHLAPGHVDTSGMSSWRAVAAFDPGDRATLADRLKNAGLSNNQTRDAVAAAGVWDAICSGDPAACDAVVADTDPEVVDEFAGVFGGTEPFGSSVVDAEFLRAGSPVDGNDLIAAGVKPGPELGEGLKRARAAWFESRGDMTTTELVAAAKGDQ